MLWPFLGDDAVSTAELQTGNIHLWPFGYIRPGYHFAVPVLKAELPT